jgi:hypothetical protein
MPQALGDMPLHLRAEHQFGLGRDDRVLDFEMIVGDQRLQRHTAGRSAHVAGELAAVAAKAADLEAQLVIGDPGRGDRVGGIAEDEDPLAGQIGGIDRPRPPGHALEWASAITGSGSVPAARPPRRMKSRVAP